VVIVRAKHRNCTAFEAVTPTLCPHDPAQGWSVILLVELLSPIGTSRPLAPLLLLVAALTVWTAGPAARLLAQSPALPSYNLEASVDYASATVRVEQTVRFRNRTGLTLDRVVFQVATAYYGAFELLAASAQGRSAAARLDGTVLEVPLPSALNPGADGEVGLSYLLRVPRSPGRISAGQHALSLGNWFPTLAPHRGEWDRHQFVDVGDAHVTEVANFDVRLATSIPLVVAASGRLLEDSGTSFHLQALGVRDFALSLSPNYQIAEVEAGNVIVRAYTFSRERSRLFAQSAAKFLRWYSDRFAPYPYRTLSLAETDMPAAFGGLEYPAMIFLASSLGTPVPFEGSSSDVLIGHEVAHQWFYSLVGVDQVHDPWLDEAFAQYLPYHYYRHTAPATFQRLWNGMVAGLDERARSAGGLPVDASVYDFADDGPYFVIVYRQGARFLEELRQTMGEAAFEAALAEEIGIFADKLASPRAVLDLFQRHTPTNLNPLIARYFSYGGFGDPSPARWQVELPESPWRGSVYLVVGAEFPLTGLEVWLDSRRLYSGEQNAITLDLSSVEPGDYALLVRIWDHRGVQFERARRVSVAGS
jgi:hypothetical protein